MQIKQLALPMAVRKIGQGKLSLVVSEHFPVIKLHSRSVAKSA